MTAAPGRAPPPAAGVADDPDSEAFRRCRQVVQDTWRRSRLAGFLYVFGWIVVAWLGGLAALMPALAAGGALGFTLVALLRLSLPPPAADDAAGHARWLRSYPLALNLAPLLWALLQARLLTHPTVGMDAVVVSVIATIGYATVIANVYTTLPRVAVAGAAVLFVPMLAALWAEPAQRALAVACTLYAVYLVGALPRSAREYRRRLDLDAELREQRDRYAQLSRTDPLTGLANRRQFAEHLVQASRDADAFSLLILDIDHFKRINDAHGHAVGDACLRALAARLQAHFADAAVIARLGGEEFGVLLAQDGTAAAARAEGFRGALAAAPLDCDGRVIGITVSIGVGRFTPERHRDGDGLYRAVDRALYAAKRGGRDRVVAGDDAVVDQPEG